MAVEVGQLFQKKAPGSIRGRVLLLALEPDLPGDGLSQGSAGAEARQGLCHGAVRLGQ